MTLKVNLPENNRTVLLFVLICSALLYSCNNSPNNVSHDLFTPYHKQYQFAIATGCIPSIQILNQSDSLVNIQFSIDNRLWLTKQSMLNYIRNYDAKRLPDTDTIISKAFFFVIDFTEHKSQIYMPKKYGYSPDVLINSLGYGICSNIGAVLANILIEMGYKSRCVQLGGHLVTEVFDKGKWKMLDADNEIYFVKNDKIASVQQIAEENDNCKPIWGHNFRNIFNEIFPESYMSFYSSIKNNTVESLYTENIAWDNKHISLPPQSNLQIPVYNPNAPKNTSYFFGRLRIPKPYYGAIEIPFVMHSVTGSGHVFNLHSIGLHSNKQYVPGVYWGFSDSIDVYFYVNPLIFDFESSMITVDVFSDKESSLIVKCDSQDFDYFSMLEITNSIYRLKNDFSFLADRLSNNAGLCCDTIETISLDTIKDAAIFLYKKTRNSSTVPDSILNKINLAIAIMEKKNFESSKAFQKMQFPFYRNMLVVLLLELSTDDFQRMFDFYFN